jgi:DNA-binding CsgD family transcriptional regulator
LTVAVFDTSDKRALRALTRELDTLRDDEHDVLRDVTAEVAALIDIEKLAAYDVVESAHGGMTSGFVYTVGTSKKVFASAFDELLERFPSGWALYNPMCPEPEQRNEMRIFSPSFLRDLMETRGLPMAEHFFPRVGFDGRWEVRTLLCDGPSLLGWFGGFQPAPFTPRQTELLRALSPSLRRRLRYDRLLRGERRGTLIAGALEHVATAVFVLSPEGTLVQTNKCGRTLLEREGRMLLSEISALRPTTRHPRWSVVPLRSRGTPNALLVLEQANFTAALASQLALVATRWNLTPRQREVFAYIAKGHPNKTIAAFMGISPRTVEVHVAAILVKAEAESRADVLARMYATARE